MLEIHWEKIISCKTTYKVAWLSLTYYLRSKARPLSVKKKVQKMFHLFFLYAQVRIHGRYFYIRSIYFSVCIFFLALKMFCSSYNVMTDWTLLNPEEEPLLVFLGFSVFLSFLFFFSPHLLHWLSDFSRLSAVGCFVRNQSILLIVYFFF